MSHFASLTGYAMIDGVKKGVAVFATSFVDEEVGEMGTHVTTLDKSALSHPTIHAAVQAMGDHMTSTEPAPVEGLDSEAIGHELLTMVHALHHFDPELKPEYVAPDAGTVTDYALVLTLGLDADNSHSFAVVTNTNGVVSDPMGVPTVLMVG